MNTCDSMIKYVNSDDNLKLCTSIFCIERAIPPQRKECLSVETEKKKKFFTALTEKQFSIFIY